MLRVIVAVLLFLIPGASIPLFLFLARADASCCCNSMPFILLFNSRRELLSGVLVALPYVPLTVLFNSGANYGVYVLPGLM